MNSASWKSFFDNTDKFSKPAQAKKLVSDKDLSEIKHLINDVLIGFLAKKDIHVGLKTYVNNELRNDFIEKMVANPPQLEDSLENWSQNIFGDQKFGMVLIGLEQYSNSFAERVATIMRPMLEVAGLPLDGLSFLFFMGNYGFTPFGIHKEATGEDGILFHLGPENKQFYTWDDPKYNKIEHNSEVFHNVSEMISEGKVHNLEPGDAMFIPHYVYHIANTPKFSLSFVLDYINPPKDRFENELIEETAREKLNHENGYEKPIKLNSSQAELNTVIDLQSIEKKIQLALSRKIKGLKSNGGIKTTSNKTRTTIPNTENFSFKSKEIFPIELEIQDAEKIIIFARGHRIIIKNHPMVHHLIDTLNKGELMTFKGLRKLMEPLWDLITILSFIQELLSVEAIIVDGIKD